MARIGFLVLALAVLGSMNVWAGPNLLTNPSFETGIRLAG